MIGSPDREMAITTKTPMIALGLYDNNIAVATILGAPVNGCRLAT
jgi:hypothetical protein